MVGNIDQVRQDSQFAIWNIETDTPSQLHRGQFVLAEVRVCFQCNLGYPVSSAIFPRKAEPLAMADHGEFQLDPSKRETENWFCRLRCRLAIDGVRGIALVETDHDRSWQIIPNCEEQPEIVTPVNSETLPKNQPEIAFWDQVREKRRQITRAVSTLNSAWMVFEPLADDGPRRKARILVIDAKFNNPSIVFPEHTDSNLSYVYRGCSHFQFRSGLSA